MSSLRDVMEPIALAFEDNPLKSYTIIVNTTKLAIPE